MLHPIRAYQRSQEAQYRWIREHPVLYVTTNVIVAAMFIGYIEIKDRLETRKMFEEIDAQKTAETV